MTEKYDHEIIHHDPSEGFDPTEPAAPRITLFVVISIVTLIVVIGALQFYFDGVWDAMTYDRVLTAPKVELNTQRDLEAWRLTHYEYATPEKSRVRIPLERARELFLQEAAEGRTFYKGQPTVPMPEEVPAPGGAAAAGEAPGPGKAAAPGQAPAPGKAPQEAKQ